MAKPKPTNQWACIAILALMGSTLTMAHVVKPPPRPARTRKLQMYQNDEESETNRFLASNSAHKAANHHQPQTDKTQASASGCGGNSAGREGRDIYGEGHGSGGTTFGVHTIFPFPSFPIPSIVPEVSTWGEGGGSGRSNNNPGMGTGMGVSCQCNNGYPMQYVISPIHFQPKDSTSFNTMKKDGPNTMAPSPSRN